MFHPTWNDGTWCCQPSSSLLSHSRTSPPEPCCYGRCLRWRKWFLDFLPGWNLTILLHAGPPRFHNISQSIGRIRATIAWQIRNSPPHPTNNLKSAGPGSIGGSVLTTAQIIVNSCVYQKTFEKVRFRRFTVNGMHLTKSCRCQGFCMVLCNLPWLPAFHLLLVSLKRFGHVSIRPKMCLVVFQLRSPLAFPAQPRRLPAKSKALSFSNRQA